MVRRRVRQDRVAEDLQRLFEFRSEDWPGSCAGQRFGAFQIESEREIEREKVIRRGYALALIRAKYRARRAINGHHCNTCGAS